MAGLAVVVVALSIAWAGGLLFAFYSSDATDSQRG